MPLCVFGILPCHWTKRCALATGCLALMPLVLTPLSAEMHGNLGPGIWQAQYQAWLPARAVLLRIDVRPAFVGRGGRGEGAWKQRETAGKKGESPTLVRALRQVAHQYLDDADYSYERLNLHLHGGLSVSVTSSDPGADAVGVEALGRGREEVVVLRRLGGVLAGKTPPELVVRSARLGAGYLTGERACVNPLFVSPQALTGG